MKKNPLVSVIIATKNEEDHIKKLLDSIAKQTYTNIEIILVDNYSTDKTVFFAKEWDVHTYTKGPERSAQRNYGVKKARGEYILFLDADMIVSSRVISSCIEKINNNPHIVGIIIPEKSIGKSFWAKCKALEKSFYVGVSWMEAARFFKKSIFYKIGGYDVELISGEDFDLSQKVEKQGKLGRINKFILHDEGSLGLLKTIQKKLYYAKYYGRYTKKWKKSNKSTQQINIVRRYMLFFQQPKKLFKSPLIGVGMLLMKTSEFFFGGIGFMLTKFHF